MSFFARRNDERRLDPSESVEEVTLDGDGGSMAGSPPPNGHRSESISRQRPPRASEITFEAEDDEPNGRIGSGSRVVGKLSFEGSIRVYGEVDGEIRAAMAVIVRRGGRVTGEIHACEVVIEGDVTANVHATSRIEIGVTGSLSGKVSAPRLVIHDGGVFDGSSSMTGEGDASDAEAFVEGDLPREVAELVVAL